MRSYHNIAIIVLLSLCIGLQEISAGNPDRQGEAGAYELLLNPWARSAGLHTMTTAMISGVESMRLNIAGLSRINKSEFVIGHTELYDGSGLALNSVGLAQRVGESGVIGLSLMSVDFGEIDVTTTDLPEGTGATFSPSFFHLGISYAKIFENKVSVGILFRTISETTSDLSAFGFALDAGVQYVTGPNDNFKFGISLRNIGSPMRFGGDGLSFRTSEHDGPSNVEITVSHRTAKFELPSMLNLGISYDFLIATKHRITPVANFTANSFARDQIGGGIEYAFSEMFMVRGGYKYDLGSEINGVDASIYSGISAGVTIEVPLKKQSSGRFAVDYAYRATSPFEGTHSFSIRYKI